MNTREKNILNRAIEVSKISTCKQKHGVVIAAGRRILAIAVNTDRNDPKNEDYSKHCFSFHAEVNAIKQLRGMDLSRVTLYSARTNNVGYPMNAKPCSRCEIVIRTHKIKKIIHT